MLLPVSRPSSRPVCSLLLEALKQRLQQRAPVDVTGWRMAAIKGVLPVGLQAGWRRRAGEFAAGKTPL
jgi:hypothetical protein